MDIQLDKPSQKVELKELMLFDLLSYFLHLFMRRTMNQNVA